MKTIDDIAVALRTIQHQQGQQKVAEMQEEVHLVRNSQAECSNMLASNKAESVSAMALLTTQHQRDLAAVSQQMQQEKVAPSPEEVSLSQGYQGECCKAIAFMKADHARAITELICQHQEAAKEASH